MAHDDWLVCDVGNTRVKAGRFAQMRVHSLRASAGLDEVEFDRTIGAVLAEGPVARAAICSVNSDEMTGRVERCLTDRGLRIEMVLRSDGRILEPSFGLIGHTLETPQTTGVDRVLEVVGALEESPGAAVIVVDCGSATTVNLGTGDRVFHGGAILPGLRLMSAALNLGTTALPAVDVTARPVLPGRSTKAAIQAGLYFGLCGAIDRLINDLAQSSGTTPVVYVTGGDASVMAPGLQTGHIIAPHLVLKGLGHAAILQARQRPNPANQASRRT
jgi:type III pantothenate kinase